MAEIVTKNQQYVYELGRALDVLPYTRKNGESAFFFTAGDLRGVAPTAVVDAAKLSGNPGEYLKNCRVAQISVDGGEFFWCLMRPGAQPVLTYRP